MNIFKMRGCFYVVLLLVLTQVSLAVEIETSTLEHFKMLSTVEYSGQWQFTNQIETLFTVEKTRNSTGTITDYLISTPAYDLVSKDQSSSGGISFFSKYPHSEHLNQAILFSFL